MFVTVQRTSLLASIALSFFAAAFHGQQIGAEIYSLGVKPSGYGLGFGAAYPVVINRPYSAHLVIRDTRILPDGKPEISESHNLIARDSKGRLRNEQIGSPMVKDADGGSSSFVMHAVTVIDVVNNQQLQWDLDDRSPNKGVVHVLAIPSASTIVTPSILVPCDPARKSVSESRGIHEAREPLGNRTIEGVIVIGCRITRDGTEQRTGHRTNEVSELWTSSELQITVKSSMQGLISGEERIYELQDLSTEEPSPALFEPPHSESKPNSTAAETATRNPECAEVTRHGDEVTLVADSIRVVDSIANTLAQQFGVVVSTEEPQYQFSGDLEDVSSADPEWSAQHPKAHYLVPKRRKIELKFSVLPSGSPAEINTLLQQVVQKANDQMPFGYRLDVDGEFFALVPTTTRNSLGAVFSVTPLLDRKVTIPLGTRSIAESAKMMADSLSVQTGLNVSCCQMFVAGIPWGISVAPFEARDEPARKVLERLIVLNQQSKKLSSRGYWLLRCDNGWCFINVHPVSGGACRWWTH